MLVNRMLKFQNDFLYSIIIEVRVFSLCFYENVCDARTYQETFVGA
jgi:hypothetical protein